MKLRVKRSYAVYSAGVTVAGAVVLILASLSTPAGKRKNVFLVFAGFGLGWLSATIARYVYPPPRKYRPAAGETPPARR